MFDNFIYLFIFLSVFWLIRTSKAILFWLYLWQLKEYHLGRFKTHFQTEKGKKLFKNFLFITKLILLFPLLFLSFSPFILLALYFLESGKAVKDFSDKKIKKPVWTKKTIPISITAFSLYFTGLFFLFKNLSFSQFVFSLLLIDILTPVLVSLIVLALQPLTVLLRNRILKAAKEKRENFKNLIVIGITGSYGKTSAKEFLYAILSEKFKVLKTEEHQNSEIGISQCILNDLKLEHQIFICEMGAYNRGGIKLLCDIAKPQIGILTGINKQHLATFGSQENIIKTKFELIEALSKEGIAFFNGRNKYCRELYQKTKINKKLYGEEAKSADLENIAGAIAVAKELGMSDEEIASAREKIKPWLQVKKGINNLNIIDSSYSANPDSVISHLEYLKNWQGKKIIVMPCLIELGKASKEVHQRIGEKIAEVCDLAIITTKECFAEVEKSCYSKECQVVFLENPKEIFEKIKDFNQENDIILLEGRLAKELIDLFYVDN